jgi:capsular polysaccharide export protein
VEYAAYLKRFAELKLIRRREYRRVRGLLESGVRYYVLPLQLNSDAQIRDHSRFEHMGEVIAHVLESFAKHAPEDARIVIKNHPLDTGLMNFRRIVRDCERQFGLAGRTVYVEDGDLVSLVRHAQGVVTVNSTVGIVALEQGTPTVALSDPIYNLPGLTFQGPLDEFWMSRIPPDAWFFSRFRRVVMHATQVNGGLYCPQGIDLAVENSTRILTAQRSPLEALL